MKLRVNPNRMVLLTLKKRLNVARRGHKLLKDKLEGMIKEFLSLVSEYKKLRKYIDDKLPDVLKNFLLAKSMSQPTVIETALEFPKGELKIEIKEKNIMNIKTPKYEIVSDVDLFSYGFLNTPSDLDEALISLKEIFSKIIRLAELEQSVRIMAKEIERTRRRVNALEYVMIPSLQETVKYIKAKLEEMERSNNSRLMRIKEIIRAH